MPVNRHMHSVLNGREKIACGRGSFVVIDGGCIQISYLLVELAFAQPNFTDSFQQVLEILVPKRRAVLKASVIENPALDCIFADNLVRPLAKLHGSSVVYLEPDGDDDAQVVMVFKILFPIRSSSPIFLDY